MAPKVKVNKGDYAAPVFWKATGGTLLFLCLYYSTRGRSVRKFPGGTSESDSEAPETTAMFEALEEALEKGANTEMLRKANPILGAEIEKSDTHVQRFIFFEWNDGFGTVRKEPLVEPGVGVDELGRKKEDETLSPPEWVKIEDLLAEKGMATSHQNGLKESLTVMCESSREFCEAIPAQFLPQ